MLGGVERLSIPSSAALRFLPDPGGRFGGNSDTTPSSAVVLAVFMYGIGVGINLDFFTFVWAAILPAGRLDGHAGGRNVAENGGTALCE